MVITICSSIDFTTKILEIKRNLELNSHAVNIPYFSEKIAKGEITMDEFLAIKEQGGDISMRKAEPIDLIKRHYNLIKSSDAILVLNNDKKGIENYIGGSTLMEMGFAYVNGKKIYLYNDIPLRSERMHYIDEIIDMKPVVIFGNLKLIK